MVFIGFGHPAAGVLALIAALYHTLNHAVFKDSCFSARGRSCTRRGLRNSTIFLIRDAQDSFLFS